MELRRVIIQIFSVYIGLFYTFSMIFIWDRPISRFLLISAFLNFLVIWKLTRLKERTNMLYISMFLYLSFLINYFVVTNFLSIANDKMAEYIYRTLPHALVGGFLLMNIGMVFLALIEFANSKVVD